ncbi:MAG: hypothetical protein KAI83_05170 [Thiomargarita sp.]|nr:hypothetical protein [Thiomargarita sp.]
MIQKDLTGFQNLSGLTLPVKITLTMYYHTFLDFDPENMKVHFQNFFEEGQELAMAQASK